VPDYEGLSEWQVTYAEQFLESLDVDTVSPDMRRTPLRFAKALAELTRGLREPFDAGELLARQFDVAAGGHPQMVMLCGIPFTSVCEHHLLPFTGTASVAYLPQPGARVAGVSKLARLVEGLAARPQMQERLGEQVTGALGEHLKVQGAGCLIDAVHTCLTLRGPRAAGARMVTSHLSGCFLDGTVRQEFLALARTVA
jgi:GTP cyclohydrolase IA